MIRREEGDIRTSDSIFAVTVGTQGYSVHITVYISYLDHLWGLVLHHSRKEGGDFCHC
jgi:hypothetical protein